MPELCSDDAVREESPAVSGNTFRMKCLWRLTKNERAPAAAKIWGGIANLLTISPRWLSRS
jgi:hypothetical protein